MRRSPGLIVLVGLFMAVALAPALASDINVGQWYEFTFTGTGSWGTAGSIAGGSGAYAYVPAADPSWTFTASGPVKVTVTDAWVSGDQFGLWDAGSYLGATSAPTQGNYAGNDIQAALSDPYFSKGVYWLGAGSHSLDIEIVDSPYGYGNAYFRADAVPEPAFYQMAGLLALGGLGVFRMRRRSAT
jgi:hypothetical protein